MQQNLFTSNLAEISVTYSSQVKVSDRRKVVSAREAEEVFREIWTKGTMELREEMYVLYLNRGNYLLGWLQVSQGGLSGTVCDPRMIFSVALKSLAVSLLISHNHPSGNLQPSTADIQLTKNLVEGGKYLEISVLDHLILTAEGFYSFSEKGLI